MCPYMAYSKAIPSTWHLSLLMSSFNMRTRCTSSSDDSIHKMANKYFGHEFLIAFIASFYSLHVKRDLVIFVTHYTCACVHSD